MNALHWVDYTIIAIVGISVITGLCRGLVKESIAVGVWVLAIWLAVTYAHPMATLLQPLISDASARAIAAFVAIVVATLIAGGLFNTALSFILKRSGLSGTDRILGMGFGFVRGVFIVALLMLVVNMTSLPHEAYRRESRLYSAFDPLVSWISGYTPAFIQRMQTIDESDFGTVRPTTASIAGSTNDSHR